MPAVVAFLSQKGGVGKSTLARSLAVVAADVGLRVRLADLDPQQRTLLRWLKARRQARLQPEVDVVDYDTPQEALRARGGDTDLLVLDLPGQLSNAVVDVANDIQLFLQPTSPSVDDLHPALLVFEALQRVGVPAERMAFALCRVLSDKEADASRGYIEKQGHAVLRGAIKERLEYREALNVGRTLSETRLRALNTGAQLMMLDLLERVLLLATGKKRQPVARVRRKA